MSTNGNTQLIFTLQGDQNQLVANFGPFLPLQVNGTLQDMITTVANAEASVLGAEQAATTATTASTQAAASATSASASATAAQASASNSAASATSSSTYATLASAWAQQPTGNVNGTAYYSSYYYSQQSQYWANIAQAANAAATTFDPAYKAASVTLSNNNLTATFVSGQSGILGTVGYGSGKHYFEVTYVSGSSSGNASIGIAPSNETLNSQIGYNDNTGAIATFQTSGNVYVSGSKLGSASGYGTHGNVLCVAVDSDDKLVWFRTNNGNWNGSGTADPVAKVGGFSYSYAGAMFPAVCTDSASVYTANFTGNFTQTIPAGYRAWAADAYHYVVPYATAINPGIVSAGPGLSVNAQGQLSADTYYDIATIQASSAITIDLTNPSPGYHIILNDASATFSFANLTLPQGSALRLTFYFEQGTGNNTITSWDSSIKWVGAAPILAYTQGARNVIEFETIDGVSFAGYYVGQINP